MNLQDYQNLIETYGTHPARWPQVLRANALSFGQSNQEAIAPFHANYQQMDQKLEAYASHHRQTMATALNISDELPEPVTPLMETILQRAQNTAQTQPDDIAVSSKITFQGNDRSNSAKKPKLSIQTPANDHPTRFLAEDDSGLLQKIVTWGNNTVKNPAQLARSLAASLILVAGVGFTLFNMDGLQGIDDTEDMMVATYDTPAQFYTQFNDDNQEIEQLLAYAQLEIGGSAWADIDQLPPSEFQ